MPKNLLGIYFKLSDEERDYIVYSMRHHSNRKRCSFSYDKWPVPNALLDVDEVLAAIRKLSDDEWRWSRGVFPDNVLINKLRNYRDCEIEVTPRPSIDLGV